LCYAFAPCTIASPFAEIMHVRFEEAG
jgi:hypothetical protein